MLCVLQFFFCVCVYIYVADSTLSPHAHAGLEIVETSKFWFLLPTSSTLQIFSSEKIIQSQKNSTQSTRGLIFFFFFYPLVQSRAIAPPLTVNKTTPKTSDLFRQLSIIKKHKVQV